MKFTIIDLLEDSVAKYGDLPYLWEKKTKEFEPTSFNQFKEQVYNFGAGLMSLGVEAKDNIALLSEGRNDWLISEVGLFYAGAVSIPLSVKLNEKSDLLFRMNHAEVKYIIVSGLQLAKIRAIKDEIPSLLKVIILDEVGELLDKEVYFKDIMAAGEEFLKHSKQQLLDRGAAVQNDDLATITYTSGTTADPKGVMLTHRNYTANVDQALTVIDVPQGKKMLVILPLDHCFAHVVGIYAMMRVGGILATVPAGKNALEALRNIPMSIQQVKPNILLSVPALAKSFKKNIEGSVAKSGKVATALFNFGLKTAIKYNKEGWNKGTGGTWILKPIVSLFSNTLFKKVRSAMGGELDFFVGGGALLDINLQKFYYALNMPMFQGYGLSEATPVISTNAAHSHRLGSSGNLVKPMDIKIMDAEGNECPTGVSGEIVIRGENVMAGYWKNPKSTSETVKDGWLYTGDMGYLHESGFLYVLGRFKSLLIASDGEKYAPEGIEEAITSKVPYVNNVMMYNNQSPYSICVLDVDKTKLPKGEAGAKQIMKDLGRFKSGGEFEGLFPERWLPATFIIADEPFSEANKMINSTMKMVRNKVESHYKKRIDYAYTPEGKDVCNKYNVEILAS